VACKPLLGEVAASPPNVLEEADDPPRNPNLGQDKLH